MYQEKQPLNLVEENSYESLKSIMILNYKIVYYFSLCYSISKMLAICLQIVGKFKIFSKLTSTFASLYFVNKTWYNEIEDKPSKDLVAFCCRFLSPICCQIVSKHKFIDNLFSCYISRFCCTSATNLLISLNITEFAS